MCDRIDNAGAIFLGPYSPVAVGDYAAGPSHTLPTGGTARFTSGLSACDFLRRSSVHLVHAPGLAEMAGDVVRLAEVEGLTGARRERAGAGEMNRLTSRRASRTILPRRAPNEPAQPRRQPRPTHIVRPPWALTLRSLPLRGRTLPYLDTAPRFPMFDYLRPSVRAMAGYTPGEQPRQGDIIKLNTNENPYPPSPRVFEAVAQALTGDRLRKYPDPVGTAFRRAAGRVLDVDPDGIVIGNGSDDILTILTLRLRPRGRPGRLADAELHPLPHARRAARARASPPSPSPPTGACPTPGRSPRRT